MGRVIMWIKRKLGMRGVESRLGERWKDRRANARKRWAAKNAWKKE